MKLLIISFVIPLKVSEYIQNGYKLKNDIKIPALNVSSQKLNPSNNIILGVFKNLAGAYI